MSLLFLIIAFLLTGVTSVSNKALIPMHLDGYLGIYSLSFWAGGMMLGLLGWAFTKHEIGRRDVAVGVVMGVAGAAAMVLLLVALRTVPGVVAFPVRSCGNTALTAVVSYVAWREKVTPKQWIGIGCGLAAIYLLL